MLTRFRWCAFALGALLCQVSNGAWVSDSQAIMGTHVAVELWADEPAEGERLIRSVMDEMRRVEARFSPYDPGSELSRMNRGAPHGDVAVTPEMVLLLDRSRQVSELTGGAFDVTYASVGRYYDYREGEKPNASVVDESLAAIDYRHVQVDRERGLVRYAHPAVYVDLGGIAKGYAVDRSIAILDRAGVQHASVEAGGDSRILGDRRGRPWTIGVRDPRRESVMVALLPLIDTAVSTSGDYERFFEADGVRYHHILDPASGDSARKVRSVTILGPDATFTDALSTSVFVMGVEAGLALVDGLTSIDAIIVDGQGRLHYSADLESLQQ